MEEPAGKIFLHEKAHAQNRHWMDLLFADLSCILLWYNPFVWMTRRLMKLNHEFEADSAVISSGVDTYEYQRLLVMKAMGRRAIPVTNSFAVNRRDFRKRVLLMGKKRSSAKTMLIAFGGIPAVFRKDSCKPGLRLAPPQDRSRADLHILRQPAARAG